jgi:hypothetical protein
MICKKPIVDSLRLVTGGQAFITATQLARALGCADSYKVKSKYLKGLPALNGKYYLILDVAEELRKQMS